MERCSGCGVAVAHTNTRHKCKAKAKQSQDWQQERDRLLAAGQGQRLRWPAGHSLHPPMERPKATRHSLRHPPPPPVPELPELRVYVAEQREGDSEQYEMTEKERAAQEEESALLDARLFMLGWSSTTSVVAATASSSPSPRHCAAIVGLIRTSGS